MGDHQNRTLCRDLRYSELWYSESVLYGVDAVSTLTFGNRT